MRSVAAIAATALVLVLAGGGVVLSRIDRLRAEDGVHDAKLRLVEARLELARAELLGRHVAPADDPRVEVLVRRTTALRGAILALVRTGTVAMPGDPGGDWAVWPLELAEVPR